MKTSINIKRNLAFSLMAGLVILNSCAKKENAELQNSATNDLKLATSAAGDFYTETGTNPSFASLNLKTSTTSVPGSTINVNNSLVEVSTGANDISTDIQIHTLHDTYISYNDASNFKRWWQLDGKTQVFRLFKNEVSIVDPRGEHPRIEAFSGLNWTYNANVWHTWYGRYTIISTDNDGACIFQDKNSDNDWAFQLLVNSAGDIILDDRNLPVAQNVVVKPNAIGQGFNVRVRDNGKDWECYISNVLVGSGSYNRPTGNTKFRWGMYASKKQLRNSMLFVSGVHFD